LIQEMGKVGWCRVLSLALSLLVLVAAVGQLALAPVYAAGPDILYEGTVNLTAGATISVTVSGTQYNVDEATPLGALVAAGFSCGLTDKKYADAGILLLDDVGTYTRKNPGNWYVYVNGNYKDGFAAAADAVNLFKLTSGDEVEFYYAASVANADDYATVKAAAIAAIKTVVAIEGKGAPATGKEGGPGVDADAADGPWTLDLVGAKRKTVTKAEFEDGLACKDNHQVVWTDDEGNEWGGLPLWLLVAMVDDDPDQGPDHYNFNDELAAQGYAIDVIAADGWKATLDSAAVARNDGYLIANTLNGEPLPLETPAGKDCWPLHLKGADVFGGQQVGKVARIELTGLPQAAEGWTLKMSGKVDDVISQREFEKAIVCAGVDHGQEWTDNEGRVWSGVPLWVLVGAVDNIEESDHWTFDRELAAAGYTVRVVAEDGFAKSFASKEIADSKDYIIANKCDGVELSGSSAPLRLVGAGVAKEDGSLGGSAVGNIAEIEIPEFQTPEPAAGDWKLTLNGKIGYVMSKAEFEEGAACHNKKWTDAEGNIWSGIPLWYLAGWVDDRKPHDFDVNTAKAGYTVLVKAEDGYTKDFSSDDIAFSDDYIIANQLNGKAVTESAPLRLVGAGVATDGVLGGHSVGNVAAIELTAFGVLEAVPEVRIVKYGEDGVTVIAEETVDYLWMEENLDVIGDGETVYRYEGITNNPDDIWGDTETYPGGYKIANAVKGTRVRDLVELVGGMGAGTEIVLVAVDGWETRLPYSSIYTDPAVQERQGDAILAWWADGQYVPDYSDGIRLFFTPGGDHVYSQRDMRDTLPEAYWHFYGATGLLYPSCAGLSVKQVGELRVYSVASEDWTLELDGEAIGGLTYDVSKTYWESGLTCQFGANHKSSYTDGEGQVWEGMALWLLAGFVDDQDQHSNDAFNTELAKAGYNIVLTAADGYSITIHSTEIIRNKDYIVASLLDGNPIAEASSDWPLKLVGPGVHGARSIAQIVKIELVPDIPGQLTDIAGHWAENNIKKLFDLGIVTGRPDGSYRPDDNITRAEFASVLVKALKLEGEKGIVFSDTVAHWAKDIVALAAEHGIVSGYDEDTFGPNDLVNREQMAAMVVRGTELAAVEETFPFGDRADFSDWAEEAISEAAAAGIISGYPNGNFGPQDHATKAQAATVVANLLAVQTKSE
jgi:DMSO/TMAO reductase YedYZ molybdopterin-dependent catalytic subunit